MKRILTMLLSLLLCFALTISCAAAPIVYKESEADDEGKITVTSYTYLNDADGKSTKLYTAVYDSEGNVISVDDSDETSNAGYLKTTVTKSAESNKVKSFLWNTADYTPLVNALNHNSDINIDDITITLDGKDLRNLIDDELTLGGEYNLGLYENRFEYFPTIKVKSKDSGIVFEVTTDEENLQQVITISKNARYLNYEESDNILDYTHTISPIKTVKVDGVDTKVPEPYELERYARETMGTITLNYIVDYISNDIVEPKNASTYRMNVNDTPLNYEHIGTIEVEEGSVKTVSVTFDKIARQTSMIFVVPTDESKKGTPILVKADGSALSWADNKEIIAEYNDAAANGRYGDDYVTKWGKFVATANSNVTMSYVRNKYTDKTYTTISNTTPYSYTLMPGSNLNLPVGKDSPYVTGVNVAHNTYPKSVSRELHSAPDKIVGADYIPLYNVASDVENNNTKVYEKNENADVRFTINSSAQIIYVTNLANTTVKIGEVPAEGDITYKDMPVTPTADYPSSTPYRVRYSDGALPITIAYYIFNGYYDETDVVNEFTGNYKEAPDGTSLAAAVSQTVYRMRDYDKNPDIKTTGYVLKSLTNSIFADYTTHTHYSTSQKKIVGGYSWKEVLDKWVDTAEYSFKGARPNVLNKSDIQYPTISGEETLSYTLTKSDKSTEKITETQTFNLTGHEFLFTKIPATSLYLNRDGETLKADGTLKIENATGALISYPDGLGLDDPDTVVLAPSLDALNGKRFTVNQSEINPSATHSEKFTYPDIYQYGTKNYTYATFTPNRDAEVMIFSTGAINWAEAEDSPYQKNVLDADDSIRVIRTATQVDNFRYLYTTKVMTGETVEVKTPGSSALFMVVVKPDYSRSRSAKLNSISVNGNEIADFDPDTKEYTYTLSAEEFATMTAPVINAVAEDSTSSIVITNPKSFPGSAVINVTSLSFDSETYVINYAVGSDYDRITNLATHSSTNGIANKAATYQTNLKIGDNFVQDRLTSAMYNITALDASLAGSDWLRGANGWASDSTGSPLYYTTYTNVCADWITFVPARDVTVKIVCWGSGHANQRTAAIADGWVYTNGTNYITFDSGNKNLTHMFTKTFKAGTTVNIPSITCTYSNVYVIQYNDYQ